MLGTNCFKITSTPLELSQRGPAEENDSGYHSNLSCINSSNNSSRGHVWNYSFVGKECVDFLYLFGERGDHSIIIKKILHYLDDKDLHNAAAVSKIWKNVVSSVPSERKRLRSYVKQRHTNKENSINGNHECEVCEERNYQSPKSRLMDIQNIRKEFGSSNSPVSSSSPPLFKNNFRFEAYQKEGRKLKLGKRLYSCPKCKLPSHLDLKILNTAECTNSNCLYRFCILCECQEHHSKMCDFISTPVVRKQSVSVGTVTSKKNLKRLLL